MLEEIFNRELYLDAGNEHLIYFTRGGEFTVLKGLPKIFRLAAIKNGKVVFKNKPEIKDSEIVDLIQWKSKNKIHVLTLVDIYNHFPKILHKNVDE